MSLTITDKRLFRINDDGQTIASRQCKFTLRLRGKATLNELDVCSIRLVPVKQYRHRVRLEQRHYCLHVQVWEPDPTPLEHADIQRPDDILGADRGSKNHAAFSNGARAHNPHRGKQRKRRRKHPHHLAG